MPNNSLGRDAAPASRIRALQLKRYADMRFTTLVMLTALMIMTRAAFGQTLTTIPDPDDYPAKSTLTKKPAPPIINSTLTKLYRTRIRQGAKLGPNFAGNFTVVTWGCGMDAYMLVVVDGKTGKVFEPPFGCMALADGYGLPFGGMVGVNPGYKPDSKLLLVVGLEDSDEPNLDDRAATIYLFDGGRFKKIYSAPAKLEQ